MANPNDDSRLIVTFENFPVLNQSRSEAEKRPCYDDMEVCRIRMGGDRLQSPVFPAWAEVPGGVENEDGYVVPMTYKEKYAEQYKKFKAGEAQTKSGTPIEALSFLTQSKVKELKALNIYTAESLASLDGAALKSLGQGGLEWKNNAQVYLDSAAGLSATSKLVDENEFLKKQLEELRKERAQYPAVLSAAQEPDEYASLTDAELKDIIEEKVGSRPRGNPARSTLIGILKEHEAQ